MKATGIVRRIDDLGRVVIPKEIRRTLRIREGDPLEIYTDREGEVILKKYSPINDLGEVISVAGVFKKDYVARWLTVFSEDIIKNRSIASEKLEMSIELVAGQYEQVKSYCIVPIVSNGDPIGAIYLISRAHFIGEVEQKTAETAAPAPAPHTCRSALPRP